MTQEQLALQLDLVFSELLHRLRVSTAKDDGLTGVQFFTLRYIAREKQLTVTDLASTLNVTLSAITGLINRLVNMGLVERQQDQGDRRVVWIRPTEKGLAIVESANFHRSKELAAYLKKVPPEIKDSLALFCAKMAEIMELSL
ncbi:MarR family winged helix-turn-helix transcriptional regulator [Zhaonella formicivorans]|uniref:MarR family winged helix-turn-helix transcriptional regulator n=1 Tax=Zhaonella formicivorans TaxID=2528593 RepID=UPI001D11B9C9|nr:MarR family transcriptional regulator [Zhaonella formicivorans]